MSHPDLEWIEFHWKVWKEESRAFWGRAILGSAVLTLSIFFQYGVVAPDIPGFTLNVKKLPQGVWDFVNASSWFLLFFLGFKFVDLMRHRVPDRYQNIVHNDHMVVGPMAIPLITIGRLLYLIFPSYVIFITVYLSKATLALWFGSLPIIKG